MESKNIFNKLVFNFSIFGTILGLLSFLNGILNNQNGFMIIGVMLALSYSILGLFSWYRIQNEKDFIKFSLGIYIGFLVAGMLPIEYAGKTILPTFNYSVIMVFTGFICNIIFAIKEKEILTEEEI